MQTFPKSIEVNEGGMRKKVKAKYKEVSSIYGKHKALDLSDLEVPQREAYALAEKYGIPVFWGGRLIFPQGKTAKDFAGKN